ncbi:hypothetical protein [Priestia aryabhattai]
MSKFNEKKTFEKEFSEDVIDIAAVTGSIGIVLECPVKRRYGQHQLI